MKKIAQLLIHHSWLIKTLLSIVIGVLTSCLISFFHKLTKSKITKQSIIYNESLIKSLYKPLQVLLWLMVFSFIVDIFISYSTSNQQLTKILNSPREIFFILTLFWLLMRFINNTEKAFMDNPGNLQKEARDPTTVRAVSQLFRVTLIVLTLLVIMQTCGISITTLLTVGGVGGIAVSFAAKDTLANFLGGLMIFWDRPFSVGEWVRSPDRRIEGIVEHIGWRLTRLRTFDKRPLYVPNGAFSTISIENPGRMLNRRIKTLVGLRYQDAPKIASILKSVEIMIQNHSEIDEKETLMVNLTEFGPSSLNFLIYAFTKTTNWIKFQAVQQDIFLKVINIIAEHGAECAFPTTTLDIPEKIKKELYR